jgi:hypothetical protein
MQPLRVKDWDSALVEFTAAMLLDYILLSFAIVLNVHPLHYCFGFECLNYVLYLLI